MGRLNKLVIFAWKLPSKTRYLRINKRNNRLTRRRERRRKQLLDDLKEPGGDSHYVEISLWKKLQTCRKTHYVMNEWILVEDWETLGKTSVRIDDILGGNGSGHPPDTCLKLYSLSQLDRHYKVHIPTSAHITVTQYLPSIPRLWWNRLRLFLLLLLLFLKPQWLGATQTHLQNISGSSLVNVPTPVATAPVCMKL